VKVNGRHGYAPRQPSTTILQSLVVRKDTKPTKSTKNDAKPKSTKKDTKAKAKPKPKKGSKAKTSSCSKDKEEKAEM